MPETTLSEFGRSIGCSPEAVSKAVKRGRLTEKSVRTVNGRPVIIDIDQARREWMSNSRRPKRQPPGDPQQPPVNPYPEYRAIRAAVVRTPQYVAIQLLEGSHKVPIVPPDSFVESAYVAPSFSANDDDYFLYAMTPQTARELARVLLEKADSSADVDRLPA